MTIAVRALLLAPCLERYCGKQTALSKVTRALVWRFIHSKLSIIGTLTSATKDVPLAPMHAEHPIPTRTTPLVVHEMRLFARVKSIGINSSSISIMPL